MSIYKRIKTLREDLGMTQDDLAVKLGYKSRSSINKIELGKSDISQSKIAEFAKALNTTPAYLMGWDDNSNGAKTQSMKTIEINVDEIEYAAYEGMKLMPETDKRMIVELINRFNEQQKESEKKGLKK